MHLFKELREDIWTRFCEAKASFTIFWMLESEGAFRRKYLATMNEFVSFFAPTIDAHEMMFVMRLSSLHDAPNKGQRKTLESLYHEVNNANIPRHASCEVSLEDIRATLGSLRKRSDALTSIRNHYFAHRLSGKLLSVPANAHTYQDTKSLIDDTELVFNQLSSYIDGSVGVYLPRYEEHTEKILEILHLNIRRGSR